MLHANNVTIAHQRKMCTVDADDAMYHIAAAFHPGQHDVAYLDMKGLRQDDALLASDNKRQHALSVNGQRHAHTVIHQSDGFFQYPLVSNHHCSLLISVQHNTAAASSGRHSRYHIGTEDASAFSVWCSPSAMRSSQRLPLMLDTNDA